MLSFWLISSYSNFFVCKLKTGSEVSFIIRRKMVTLDINKFNRRSDSLINVCFLLLLLMAHLKQFGSTQWPMGGRILYLGLMWTSFQSVYGL